MADPVKPVVPQMVAMQPPKKEAPPGKTVHEFVRSMSPGAVLTLPSGRVAKFTRPRHPKTKVMSAFGVFSTTDDELARELDRWIEKDGRGYIRRKGK